MQTVKVNFLSHLAKFIGTRVDSVVLDDPPTVAKLISTLQAKYGNRFTDNFMKNGELAQEMIVLLINGLNLKQCAREGQSPRAAASHK